MYSPVDFKIEDPEVIRSFIRTNSFGVLFSRDEKGTFHDTHVPMLVSDDLKIITGHISRANSQWKSWEADFGVKIVFHGPHAYVSPFYYESDFNVPTWNYTAVSVSGSVRVISDRDEQRAMMRGLVDFHEKDQSNPWKLDESDERFMKLFDALIFFSVEVAGIEAQFKLNQNKSVGDREKVIQCLSETGSPHAADLAALMSGYLREKLFGGKP